MVPVARRNLFAEKGRFAISVAGVGFAVLLVLIVLALYRGFSHSGETFTELPGELWAVQQGTTDPFHSMSLVPRAELEQVASVEGVAAVVPVLSRSMSFDADGAESDARFMALDVPATLDLAPEVRERYIPEEGSIVIDKTLSRKTGLGRGDAITVGGESLTVDHVAARGAEALLQFAFVSYADAERTFGVNDLANYGMIVLEPGADERTVAAEIASQTGLTVFTSSEFASAIRKEIDESFLPVITILLGIGFVVGAAVVGLTIYTATIERTREFGVMKAVGASGGYLYRIVLSQSAMLVAAGFVIGLGAAIGVAELATEAVPEFVTDFRWFDVAAVLAASVVMAFVASLIPVRRINGIDPAMVFRA